jgi:hypothetical protein
MRGLLRVTGRAEHRKTVYVRVRVRVVAVLRASGGGAADGAQAARLRAEPLQGQGRRGLGSGARWQKHGCVCCVGPCRLVRVDVGFQPGPACGIRRWWSRKRRRWWGASACRCVCAFVCVWHARVSCHVPCGVVLITWVCLQGLWRRSGARAGLALLSGRPLPAPSPSPASLPRPSPRPLWPTRPTASPPLALRSLCHRTSCSATSSAC